MRLVVFIAAIGLGTIPALAQDSAKPAKPKPPAASKAAAKAKTPQPPADDKPATQALKDSYAAMPIGERLSIQSDLIWSGDYNGGVNGEFGDRAIAAVKVFQKRSKAKETGLLSLQERETLSAAVKKQQEQVGWKLVEDSRLPGARLGIPAGLLPQAEQGATGSRWSSARGEVQVETFRDKLSGEQLSTLFEEQKKKSNRKVEYNVLRPDFFVLSGMQGLKKFYVRAQVKDNDVRGMTVLYDQAMEGIMQPVVVAMSSAFAPFSNGADPSAKRKVEYATGIIVSKAGHVVTERQATEGCHVISVSGRGNAERLAEDKAADLALLRVYGAGDLKPLSLSSEAPKSAELTLIGIADPQIQGGGGAVTGKAAKLRGVEGARVLLDAAAVAGFAGAAAIDGQGQFVGMVDVTTVTVAGAANAASQAALVPAATIRKFLESAGVPPAIGRADADAARAAIVRVICVRK